MSMPQPGPRPRPRPPRPTADNLARDPRNNLIRQQYLQSLTPSSQMPSSGWEDPYFRFPPQPKDNSGQLEEIIPSPFTKDNRGQLEEIIPSPFLKDNSGQLEEIIPSPFAQMRREAEMRRLAIMRMLREMGL